MISAWPTNSVDFLVDVGVSLLRASMGLALGVCCGVLAAILTTCHRLVDSTLGGVLRFLRSVPALALVPFVMLAFGISEMSRAVLIAWAAFFPVWINAHAGLSSVDPKILKLGSEVYWTPSAMYFHVRLPYATPFIVTGIRVSIGTSLVLLVAAEMMGASSGIAYRLVVYQQIFRLDLVCAQIVLLGLLGFLLDRIYVRFARFCCPWITI
jgi:ABC-type nitrate/sulfonate/bicarbonate transport system permease component